MKSITSATLPIGSTVHAFEAAGLGQAPYKLIGIRKVTYQACHGAPVQPGSCCMFCATGIVYQFWLRSADQKVFFVGSDCITKSGDAGLRLVIDPYIRAHERKMREERQKYAISEFDKWVKASGYWDRPMFDMPHPNRYFASQGKTLRDYQQYCYSHSGLASKAIQARKILIAEGVWKKTGNRSSKRVDADILKGIIPDGAVLINTTLFKVIPESDDDTIFVIG